MARGVTGRFDLTGPCPDCPFRTDKPFHLGSARAREIADSITIDDQGFTCHKTINYNEDGQPADVISRGRACGGVLVILEKMGRPNQEMRVAERLGMYDRSRVNLDAPVPGSMDDWVSFQTDLEQPH